MARNESCRKEMIDLISLLVEGVLNTRNHKNYI